MPLWNGAKNQLIDSAITDATGHYTLVAPTPGQYRARVILAAGSDQFSPKDNVDAGDTQVSDINPSGTDSGFTVVEPWGIDSARPRFLAVSTPLRGSVRESRSE